MESIGALIKKARKQRGWSQVFLSQKSKVPQQVISDLERERTHVGSVPTLFRLSGALEINLLEHLNPTQPAQDAPITPSASTASEEWYGPAPGEASLQPDPAPEQALVVAA